MRPAGGGRVRISKSYRCDAAAEWGKRVVMEAFGGVGGMCGIGQSRIGADRGGGESRVGEERVGEERVGEGRVGEDRDKGRGSLGGVCGCV